jgi:hypothetical protein
MADKQTIEYLKEAAKLRKDAKTWMDDFVKKQIEQNKLSEAEARTLAKQDTEYKRIVGNLKEINSIVKEQKTAQSEAIGSLMQQEQKLKSFSGLQQSIVGIERKKIELFAKGNSMHQTQKDAFGRISELNQELLGLSAEDVVSRGEINRQINVEINQLDEKAKKQNGLGDGSRELLALMKEQHSIADGISSLTSDQQKQLESQLDVYDSMKKSIGGVFDTLSLLTNNVNFAIGATVIAMGSLVNKIGDVNKELGSGFDLLNGTNVSAGLLSFIFEDTAGTVKAITSEFGDASAATFSLQTNVGLMAKNMGISNTEAASLVGSFARLNGGSTGIASDMVKTTQQFAKQNGIIPSALMADLASSTEEFALYGRDGGENILRAAGYAQKLGVSMKTLTGIADNLLDFESSITKELELGALLGRNINLNQARQLAYAGDIEGATKETLRSLGGVDAFNRMDYFQKKATADLLGTSVAEMEKMVKNQENAGSMGSVVNEKFSKMNELLDTGLNQYLGTGIQGLGGMITMAGQLNMGFAAMGTSIVGIVKGIGKGIVGLASWVIKATIFLAKMIASAALSLFNGTAFTAASKGLTTMVSASTAFFTSLKESGGLVGGLKKGFESVGGKVKEIFGGDTLSKAQKTFSDKQIAAGFGGKKAKDSLASKVGGGATTQISDSANPAKKGGLMDSMSKINMNAVLKGAAAMLVVAGAVFVFGKAVQEFMKVSWEAVGMAVVSMLALVGAVTLLGAIMTSGIGAVAILAGAAAMLVIAASVLVLGNALQAIGTGFEMMANGIGTLMPQLMSVATTIGGLVLLIPSIGLLSLAMLGLAGALTAVGIAGVAALPGLIAISAVGAVATGIGSLLGVEGGGEKEDRTSELISEIKGLRADLNGGKVAVYMDGKKVTSSVNRVMDRIGTNFYGAT